MQRTWRDWRQGEARL